MKWTSVESSALQAAAYAENQALLYLLFRSGDIYLYFDVPRWQYEELVAADSKGRYFGRNIRGRFRYERMRAAVNDRAVRRKILVTDKTQLPIIVFARRDPRSSPPRSK